MALPRFAAFKSSENGKYLKYVPNDENTTIPNYLQYSSDEIATAYTKFSLEAASNGKKQVHIRSTFNQKYLRADSSSSRWITATGVQPNEDQSDWGCTLFEIVYNSTSAAYELIHLHHGNPVDLSNDDGTRPNCLYIYTDNTARAKHGVLDWETMSLLPQHVVFKGPNGHYLKIHNQDSHDFLRFLTDDPHSSAVQHQVFITTDGKIRLKGPNNRYWRAAPNWIWTDSTDETTNNKSTLFEPYKIEKNIIALRNLGMNYFCQQVSADWKEDCLSANVRSMSRNTRLEVEESVLSRSIYNVRYRLSDARIYGENIITMDFQGAMNGSNESNTMGLKFSYIEEKTSCWSSTLALKLGYSMTMEAGIPLIVDANIEISGEITGSYSWGETQTESTKQGATYEIEVQPRTWVKVSLVATKGYCDVPFSYTQRDVLLDGSTRITEHDDGLYTGVNCYNFHYQADDATRLLSIV